MTIIDEPDVHLHPHLSSQLFSVLTDDTPSQLIVATHSPAVLDNINPEAIWEIRHGEIPKPVLTEAARLDLYRDAGFRASELTQAELIVITEGEYDRDLLMYLEPALARAAVRSAGGREGVIRTIESLAPFDIPVLGIVDRDILADPVGDELANHIIEWPLSDIEAVFLADDAVLECMSQKSLVNAGTTVAGLRRTIDEAVEALEDNAIAEIAQRLARRQWPDQYPTPRGDNPIERLRESLLARSTVEPFELDALIENAQEVFNGESSRLCTVRGKWVLNKVSAATSSFNRGDRLLMATAAALPLPPSGAVEALTRIRTRLGA